MPLDPAFLDDCPYDPSGLLLDEILLIDRANNFVRARMPAHDDLPLTRSQRAHPLRHPRHVSGGLMIHMTGMIGFVHAYYVLDLRHSEGWIGYGGRIYDGRFRALARSGGAEPLILEGKATQVRRMRDNVFAKYTFEFFQGSTLVYSGEQAAMWTRVTEPPVP